MTWLTGQRLQYSVGFSVTDTAVNKLELIPQSTWTPAYDADRAPRDGAWVTETATGSARSRRTPPAGNSRTWNCDTGAAPAAKTGSGTPKTPA